MMSILRKSIISILNSPIIFRKLIIFITDTLLIKVSALLSIFLISGEISLNIYSGNFLLLVIAPLLAPFVYLLSGQYKVIVRYTNIKEISKILIRNLIIIIILFLFSIFFGIKYTSSNVILLFFIISTYLVSAFRYFLRELISFLKLKSFKKVKTNIVIFTSVEKKPEFLELFTQDPKYNVIAILDTSSVGVGRYLYGIPVERTNFIRNIHHNIDKVLIDAKNISSSKKNKIIHLIKELKLPLFSIPSITQLLDNKNNSNKLKPFTLHDLLGREEVVPDQNLYGPNIKGKNILITGGGGSIGKELAIQIIRLNPLKVVILELNEFNLYEVNYELKKIMNLENINSKINSILGSACDEKLVKNIFDNHKINTVFHAAAYKHVEIVENNPIEGLKNNILSTYILCKNAFLSKVDSMILISSDKAVRPTNVMGVSKRISELIIQAFNERSESKIIFSLVRFGNVIGSSGSVIPLFLRQVKEGGPLSVTHKKVIRYFMTIPEAVHLILQASFLAKGGDVFLLDMGQPVNIYDLAKQIINLSGYKLKDIDNPDGDIEINIVGLKKGEKINEELLIDGKSTNTKHPKIYRGYEKCISFSEVELFIKNLNLAIEENDLVSVFNLIKKIVPEWQKEYLY